MSNNKLKVRALASVFCFAILIGVFNAEAQQDRSQKKSSERVQPSTKSKFTISGHITADGSGETIIGANVFESTRSIGTSANEYGFYSLTLPEGAHEIIVSYLGHKTITKKIDLTSNKKLDFSLSSDVTIDEVVIYGGKSEVGIAATQMGAIDIPLANIKSTPALFGEADIIKTIQMMPGVQAGTEGTSGVYVRGGGPDENLILLDGVPLYSVDHMFGFFSVFTPEAVKKVTLYKGSFPARFGGRLSSVIDVRTNDGNMREYHGAVGVGVLSSKFQFEGPIIKDRTAFNISARRSYMDVLVRPFMNKDESAGYFFYDMNAKINHKFNDKNRLYLSFYNGKDKMDTRFNDGDGRHSNESTAALQWGNLSTALRWNSVINSKLFSNTTLAFTRYRFITDIGSANEDFSEKKRESFYSTYGSGINDITYNIDFDYSLSSIHHFKFGASYLNHTFTPEVLTSKLYTNEDGKEIEIDYEPIPDDKIYAHEGSLYIEDDIELGSRTSVNLGLHASAFSIQGKTYTSLQPRLSARYQISENFVLKASYTKMSQYIHLLSSYEISLPTDLWLPATKRIKPMKADQYSVGTYYTGIKGWELSLEGYYKGMTNVLEYKDGATFFGVSRDWESKVEMGTGRAFGVEFMAQKTVGKTTGWLAYTLAKSDRKFTPEGINQGERFPYKYDRRHSLSINFVHKFSEKIDVGATWEYRSGGASTLALEKTAIIYPDNQYHWTGGNPGYIEHRNNYRMPASHHMSIGANFNKKKKHGIRTWNISIYNLYNQMNPTFIYKDIKFIPSYIDENSGGIVYENKLVLKKITILPIIPSIAYSYKF